MNVPAPPADQNRLQTAAPACAIEHTAFNPMEILVAMSLLAPTLLLWWAVLPCKIVSALILGQGTTIVDALAVGLLIISSLFFPWLIFLNRRRKFMITNYGVTVPAMFFVDMHGRLTRHWSDLETITFLKNGKVSDLPAEAAFCFSSGGGFVLRLYEIDPLGLKRLLLALQTYAPHATIEPDLPRLKLKLAVSTGEPTAITADSFTKMWEEELALRYAATVFLPLSPGTGLQNGRLMIQEQLTFGGSSAIYIAHEKSRGKVIIKEAVIPASADEKLKAKALELFDREARILGRLKHPNIAMVLDHFVENEHHYEMIAYIDGIDLRRFVKERGPQPRDFVIGWSRQICQILGYLHTQEPPVVHRDLTPDNLMLTIDGRLVLIDFGAANAFVSIATGTMVGKQAYMAPEQVKGKAVPQSDIYSLGCTIFFLLTGTDPEPLSVSDPSNGVEPDDLDDIVCRCTALDLSERYQSALEVESELASLVDSIN